ncbi:Neuronal pentraxin-1 [Myotis brandtii]|uniref:Pentraxin family member n=1 Tax=Myotis brandtii TaxID=109478 RepID=S7PZQ7_MYOBR|nr:Neuronal pentraxin-1 [Myotis brandtii]
MHPPRVDADMPASVSSAQVRVLAHVPQRAEQYSRLNSSSQTNSLKDLLQSKIDDLERQVLSRVNSLEEGKGGPKNDTEERVKIESALTSLHQRISELEKGQKDSRPGDKFQLTFPLRTNYMYAKVKRSLPEMYAFTVCMWLKSSAAPGVGTPFSYAVPGQANELVLIEWGNNPMEILINDKVGLRGAVGRRGAVSGRGWLSHRCCSGPRGRACQAELREGREKTRRALAGVAQWIECRPAD